MAQSGQRKCLSCGRFFDVNRRSGERHRYCCDAPCRRASKAASQATWLAQSQNTQYFCGPVHLARVQAWRAAHPGYGKGRQRVPCALQDSLFVQVPDLVEEYGNRAEAPAAPESVALQDSINALPPALTGLIAHLFGVTLQDSIASTIRRLVQLGEDVTNRGRGEDSQAGLDQASATTAADAPGAVAVQLD
jgi:hypothetical protein